MIQIPYNTVINEDFLLNNSLPRGAFDAVITDPPYFILEDEWDNQDWKSVEQFIHWLNKVVMKCYDLLADNRYMVMFCSQYYFANTDLMLRDTPFKIINRCVWHYNNNMGMYSSKGLKLTWEPFFLLLKGDIRNFNRSERIENNNSFFMDTKIYPMCKTTSSGYNRKQHPAQKPIELMEELVQLFSYEGDTILEPFSGSGTTLVAAKNHDRRFVGFERNPEYIPLITERLGEQKTEGDTSKAPSVSGLFD